MAVFEAERGGGSRAEATELHEFSNTFRCGSSKRIPERSLWLAVGQSENSLNGIILYRARDKLHPLRTTLG